MPEPAPQAPAPEHEPSQPASDAPPGPDAAATKSTPNSALFHTLLEAGFDPPVAYTAETQMNAMTSEIAAANVQPVLAELRQMRENMVTRADLADFATKVDLANFETRMTKWVFGALLAQTALFVALIKLLP